MGTGVQAVAAALMKKKRKLLLFCSNWLHWDGRSMGMGAGTLAHHAGGSCRSASLLTKARAPQSAPLRCQLLRGMFWFAKGVKRDGRPPAFLWFLFNIGFRQIGKTPRSQQRRGWFPPRSSQRRMPCAGCCSLVSPPWCPHLRGTAKPLGFGPFPLTLPLSKPLGGKEKPPPFSSPVLSAQFSVSEQFSGC